VLLVRGLDHSEALPQRVLLQACLARTRERLLEERPDPEEARFGDGQRVGGALPADRAPGARGERNQRLRLAAGRAAGQVREVAGQPEELELEGEDERLQRRLRGQLRLDLVQEVEEARERVERLRLRLLLDEEAEDGLEPVLSWRSELARVKLLEPGESTGYGRRFVATRSTWIGLVPVGYGDGFRRDLTGTEVLVAGDRRRVIGTVSMDSFAVELDGELPMGTPVTLIGNGLLVEEHARVAGTINYELVCGVGARPERTTRVVAGR